MVLSRRGSDWWIRLPGGPRARRVCTAACAASRLGRSRRQVYRLIKDGALPVLAKAFGELLLDEHAVAQAASAPRTTQRLPGRLRTLFPEYRLEDLNVGRDRRLIAMRVLDRGTALDVRWLLSRLPRREVASLLELEGARLLSPRSARFWSLYFGVKPRPAPEWRRSSPWPAARS